MIVYEISEIKNLMNRLLLGDEFDRFLLVEAQIAGAVRYTIDGRINHAFYRDQNNGESYPQTSLTGDVRSVNKTSLTGDMRSVDQTSLNEYIKNDEFASWKDMKPHVLAFIKGKLLPLRFKLVFTLDPTDVVKVLNKGGLSEQSEDISSLSFVISYDRDYVDPEADVSERQRMICTTGLCRRSFIMDKSPEKYWDDTIIRFMQKLENSEG